MFVNKRSIAASIVLTLITCGIYGLYWIACMANDLNALEDNHEGTTGGMVVVLSIVTCGIYTVYFIYQASKRVYFLFEDYGVRTSDNSTVNLILMIGGYIVGGVSLVAYGILQNDMNHLIDAKANAETAQ